MGSQAHTKILKALARPQVGVVWDELVHTQLLKHISAVVDLNLVGAVVNLGAHQVELLGGLGKAEENVQFRDALPDASKIGVTLNHGLGHLAHKGGLPVGNNALDVAQVCAIWMSCDSCR